MHWGIAISVVCLFGNVVGIDIIDLHLCIIITVRKWIGWALLRFEIHAVGIDQILSFNFCVDPYSINIHVYILAVVSWRFSFMTVIIMGDWGIHIHFT